MRARLLRGWFKFTKYVRRFGYIDQRLKKVMSLESETLSLTFNSRTNYAEIYYPVYLRFEVVSTERARFTKKLEKGFAYIELHLK